VGFSGFFLNLEDGTMVRSVWGHNQGHGIFKEGAIIAQPPEQSHHGHSIGNCHNSM
jgi:hypothetical protein